MNARQLIVFSMGMTLCSGVSAGEVQHWVNLASVADPETAQEIRDRATAVVPDRFFIVPVETDAGRAYRVSGGPYLRESLAEQLLGEVRRAGFAEAWISRAPAMHSDTPGVGAAAEQTDAAPPAGLDPALYDGVGSAALVDRAPPGHALHRLRRGDDDPER